MKKTDKAVNASMDHSIISLDRVRNRLAKVWLLGGMSLFLIVVVQSLLGKYGDKVQEVWGWLLPTVMPTLGMMITVLGYTAMDRSISASIVRKSFAWVAVLLSSIYLFLVLLTVLIQPVIGANAESAVGLMRLSNLWLGPFQGLVASALGVLFVSKRDLKRQPIHRSEMTVPIKRAR